MANIPKIDLDLVGQIDEQKNLNEESIVASSIREGVESEKCVVSQYRTTLKQKNIFLEHLSTCHKNNIPVEWVIDIADESNGWFYATAYHYDDSTKSLHIMVPDKHNPSFDGIVQIDHRTLHLVECIDGKTDALFNKIVRDSTIKIKWDVEWLEEFENENSELTEGKWIKSIARYYIRLTNQLLVEDNEIQGDAKGFVIITADMNLKLISCLKNRGIDDFERLVNENIVLSDPNALNSLLKFNAEENNEKGTSHHKKEVDTSNQIRKLAEMSRGLRESLTDILDERDRLKFENSGIADMFMSFTLDGDLGQGMRLLEHFKEVKKNGDSKSMESNEENQNKMNIIAEDSIYFAQKIEKNLLGLMHQQDQTPSQRDDMEALKRSLKKLRKELDEKNLEIQSLKRKY